MGKKGKEKEAHREEPALEGRDELNLAEFPIALLASRANGDRKTIHFEDRIWDRCRSDYVTRRLVISASDKYGLPTALDDEVILGLIQLSREQGFESRRVFFSRYHLLHILGWRREGKSYSRLETSLKRWLGVTLYYENAWWDKASQAWVHENFHILEQLSIYDRQRQLLQAGLGELPLSMFVWNDVVYRSFRSGYLKQIDMDLYRRLQSPIAKRLYRLLDKRFYHKRRWEFSLRELACEHVGLSRSYDTGQLKRKLRPAVDELESAGYLQPMAEAERFVRVGPGQWQVHFRKGSLRKSAPPPQTEAEPLKARLIERGVHPLVADELLASRTSAEIELRMEAVDWLVGKVGQRGLRNPAGYLVQSIRDRYELPTGFPGTGMASGDSRLQGATRTEPPDQAACRGQKENVQDRTAHYIRGLSEAARSRLEAAALRTAEPRLIQAYERAVAEGVPLLRELYLRLILEQHVTQRLAARKQQASQTRRHAANKSPGRVGGSPDRLGGRSGRHS